jgi:hypothetical protein
MDSTKSDGIWAGVAKLKSLSNLAEKLRIEQQKKDEELKKKANDCQFCIRKK